MASSWWDDFSNNLATDLAPLVALFGESPTKQYLSECLTIEDKIIFATAPLGVITAVVSAIRVRGTPSLRAFVGRAQEGTGTAEAELCSSTSREVCELYSNGGIARVFGRPKLLEIVHDVSSEKFYSEDGSKPSAGIYSFQDYIKTERGKEEWTQSGLHQKSSEPNEKGSVKQKPPRFAPNPNLSLNIGIKPRNRAWFIAAATLGVTLQWFVLVWASLTRYYYQWLRNSREDEYAVPLTVIGTVLFSLGMALCAHLVESKTKERIYHRQMPKNLRDDFSTIYWVQPGNQNIGDQIFDSFGYSDSESPLGKYITSWKDTTEDSFTIFWIWTAVVTTIIGFICQFLGLRACHSSVAVMQLGITVIMSLIRAGLRTQRLETKDNFMAEHPELFQGHELDCLALKLAVSRSPAYAQDHPIWKVFTAPDSTARNTSSNHFAFDTLRSDALEKLVVPSGSGLAGFCIRSPPTNNASADPFGQFEAMTGQDLVYEAEKDLLSWISTKHCFRCNFKYQYANHSCETSPSFAAKSVFYRSRLARMTGLEEPELEHSSYWGAKFVAVRDVALILTHSIEDTMKILFTSDSQQPALLHESWEQAFAIFWTIHQCSSYFILDAEDGEIQMSLRRTTDVRGVPESPWKADSSAIEAVLGLWLWSLKEESEKPGVDEGDTKRPRQSISRILLAHQNLGTAFGETLELDMWRDRGGVKIQKQRLETSWWSTPADTQNAVWWKNGEDFVNGPPGPPRDSRDQRRFFGWHNLKKHKLKEYTQWESLSVLEIPSNGSLLLNCAQELYSIFLTAIIHAVKDLGGSEVRQYEERFTARNENVDKIQSALVKRGLCDSDDAFACTIPVLRNQGLLKPPDEVLSLASDLADQYRRQGKWEASRALLNRMLRDRYIRAESSDAIRDSQDLAGRVEAMNRFRLSLIETCEIYHKALLEDEKKANEYGGKGMLELLEQYSGNHHLINTPFVLVDGGGRGSVPDGPGSTSSSFSLADAVRCYGRVALWHLEIQTASTVQEQLKSDLKSHFRPRNVAGSLLKAIETFDLSSTLCLLERYRLEKYETAGALVCASQNGWYMVVEALVKLGAAIEENDANGRSALSYALEHGDINTVRILLGERADPRNGNPKETNWSPCHYAAKQGHGLIMGDLMKASHCAFDLNVTDDEGMTPLDWAIELGSVATLQVILSDGYSKIPTRALHLAVERGWADMVDVLLEAPNVNVNLASDPNIHVTATPLICAVRLRRESIFDKILDSAFVNADTADQDGRTPLWWAAALGLETYTNKLLYSGKVHEFAATDKKEDTTLSIAVQLGHLEIVDQLWFVQRHPTVSLKAIFIAAKNGHMTIVGKLLPSRVRDKHHAKELLEAHGLEEVWRYIEDRVDWRKWGTWWKHRRDVSSDGLAEIGDLSEEVVTRASKIASSPFQVFTS
ncbi:putative ankyrin repeat protein [Thelonectria olida]|uniref:Ankyrin repeat protein n=1 Tax=Thelonectria olida TaxID=1576542 RepID=A0A9P8VXH1_9HYPO|nr:putative ankyrin repeat protein [Thelonectria olida]